MTRTEWLKNLRTGARVAVVDAPNGAPSKRILYHAIVRRTPSGKIYLVGAIGRKDWSTGFRRDPGAGPRAIVPADIAGGIILLEE
jgi:hypothetical protein